MGSLRVTWLVPGLAIALSSLANASILTSPQLPTSPDVWNSCGTTLNPCTVVASNFVGGANTSGSVDFGAAFAVITNDPSNPFGTNDLDFVYAVLNEATSTDSIGRITASDFSGFSTDVGYYTPTTPFFMGVAGTVLPGTVDRLSSDTVGFDFSTLSPGQESTVLVIKTNATSYKSGLLNISDSTSGSVIAYAPTGTPTPEPALIWLLAAGFGGLVAYRRFRASDS